MNIITKQGELVMTVILEIRRSKGWTQQQFCKKANLHQSVASGLENGYRKAGSVLRDRVARALNRKQSELFGPNGFPLEVKVSA